jgi:hypothetical protein
MWADILTASQEKHRQERRVSVAGLEEQLEQESMIKRNYTAFSYNMRNTNNNNNNSML